MWEVVERAQIAARPGLVWRVVREIAENIEAPATRIDVEDAPRELAWTSPIALDGTGEQAEVRRWFRLAPSWNGTEAEHGVRAERAPTASVQVEVRERVVEALAKVKARAEAAP